MTKEHESETKHRQGIDATGTDTATSPMARKRTSGSQIIELQTRGGVGRWVDQQMATYSSPKEAAVAISTLLVAFFGGPALVFYFMSWMLAGSNGTSGGGAAALAFNAFLNAFLGVLTIALGLVVINILRKPDSILIDDKGVRYRYRTPLGDFNGRRLMWRDVITMRITQQANSVNPDNRVLSIIAGAKESFNLKLGWLKDPESKAQLSMALKNHLPEIPQDPEITFYLEYPSEHSFTEIWLMSLETPPNLQHLMPPEEDTSSEADK